MRRRFLILIGFLMIVACNSNKNWIFNFMDSESDTYYYTSYDSIGTAIVQGWMTLDLSDSSQVTGKWDFKIIGSSSQSIGTQTGEGDLVGGLNNGNLWISLNPNYRDNNVFLTGTLNKNKYSGIWTYSTFVGPTSWGTFKAVRN